MTDAPVAQADFLVEIGTEELPPRALLPLAQAFQHEFGGACLKAGVAHGEEIEVFATPRRLALRTTLATHQANIHTQTAGPPVAAAFDGEGNPTRAALGFASRFGVEVDALETIETDKGPKLAYTEIKQGQATADLVQSLVETALDALPIPRRMRWGTRRQEFVRPVHWVVMLFNGSVCNTTVLGIKAGRTSRGHRFHGSGDIVIHSPASYEWDLNQGFVIADFQRRTNLIRDGVVAAATAAGGTAVIDEELLNEVTALNEWPVPLVGRFEDRFLAVPPEALISSMKAHQKYFHMVDDSGHLMPLFVTVANIDSSDPVSVVVGNERVIRPRLADAAFFYQTDCKTTQVERREQLKSIVFQQQLGTLFDKTERVANLASYLAVTVGGDPDLARRAGQLCKSDLVSNMVGEFDDLQGVMGRYYAENDGEHPDVAEAMKEHYLPAFSGDRLPRAPTGTAVALADRIDTLVGIFGIGQQPSGSRDPFALRRASLGILRILVEREIDLDLQQVLEKSAAQYNDLRHRNGLEERILTYLIDRFKAWYEDEEIPVEVFYAVAARQLTNPLDIHQRVSAVNEFSQLPEAPQLAAANKRVSNILAKADDQLFDQVDRTCLISDQEKALAEALTTVTVAVLPLIEARNYTEALRTMATLRDPVDVFFDQVMVNVEEVEIRKNRLTLLSKLRNLFLQVADISLLVQVR